MIVRETAVRETQRLAIPVLGTPEYWLALDAGYLGDHGGFFETSLLMALIPGLTDLTRLRGEPPFQGIGGGDARQSTAEEGERISEVIVTRLATLAQRMPGWDAPTRARFLRAEQALVSHQLETGGLADNVWAAWSNTQHFAAYGELLAAERFEEIIAMVGAA
jgi:creatinine amidohydrolase